MVARTQCSCYVPISDGRHFIWCVASVNRSDGRERRAATAQAFATPKQLSFDLGTGPQRPARPPGRLHRNALFFAVQPTPAAAVQMAQQAERLRDQHGLHTPCRPTRLLHITLANVGVYSSLPDDVLFAAIEVGSTVRVAPFVVTFDRVSSFKGSDRRPLVLRCGLGLAGLTTLRQALVSAMRRIGLASRSAFTPHVTLLYDRQSVLEACVEEPITWTVRDFVLVHSVQGQGQHMHRACWPLRG